MPCYSWRMRIREATEQAESMWPRHVLRAIPSAVNKGLQGGHATEATTEPDKSDASLPQLAVLTLPSLHVATSYWHQLSADEVKQTASRLSNQSAFVPDSLDRDDASVARTQAVMHNAL